MNDTAPTTPRQLRRSTSDRRIAGVAGGLGRYVGVDPVVVRVLLVLSVFLAGTGLLLYAAAWLIIPDDGGVEPLGAPPERTDLARIAGVVLVVLAGAAAIDEGAWFGDVALPLVLIATGGWLLFRPERAAGPGGDDPLVASPAPPSATPTDVDGSVTASATPSATMPGATLVAPPPAPVPTPASPAGPPTGRITLAVVTLVLGGAGLLAALDVDLSVRGVLVTCLGLTGLGLVAGAFTGRAKGLLILAAPLVLALTVEASIDVPLEGGFGERMAAPTSLAELDAEYRLVAGELVLDLTDIDADVLAGTRRVVELSVGAGLIEVDVPDDVTLDISLDVGIGDIDVLGTTDDGPSLETDVLRAGPEGAGTLELRIQVGMGEVTVR